MLFGGNVWQRSGALDKKEASKLCARRTRASNVGKASGGGDQKFQIHTKGLPY